MTAFFIASSIFRKAPLTAHLQPQVQIVDVGKDAQFQCIVSGHPVYETNWLHDGKPIIRDNRIEVSLLLICAQFSPLPQDICPLRK